MLRGAEEETEKFIYRQTWGDILTFIYFSLTCLFLGCHLTNSPAIFQLWRSINAFSEVHVNPLEQEAPWGTQQWMNAKTALTLYQSGAITTALLGESLLETFSPSMCLLFSHLMFSGGCYLFSKSTSTRCYYVACFAQGIATELLLHCVLPLAVLFGRKRDAMVHLPTFCHDVGILFYPCLLWMGFASSLYVQSLERFQYLESCLFYTVSCLAIVGVIVFPIDDDGKIVASRENFLPHSSFSDPEEQPLHGTRSDHLSLDEGDDQDFTCVYSPKKHLEKRPNHDKSVLHASTDNSIGVYDRPFYASSTVVYWLVLLCGSFFVLESSFFLNHHPQLFQIVGDNETLTMDFMWILGFVPFLNILSWTYNDKGGLHLRLGLIFFLFALTYGILQFCSFRFQWFTLIFFIMGYSQVIPTLVGIAFDCVETSVSSTYQLALALSCGCFNFINIPVTTFLEHGCQGDYSVALLILFSMNVVFLLFIICHGVWFSHQWRSQGSSEDVSLFPCSPPESFSPHGQLSSEESLSCFPHAAEEDTFLETQLHRRHADDDDWEDEDIREGLRA